MKKKLSLDDVRAMDREMLTADVVSQVVEIDPHALRLMARERPELLPFPYMVYGHQVRFPRLAFIRWMEGR